MPYEEETKNARRRAIRYLVYRDRSRNEIIRYLNGKKFSADAVDATLIFLESKDYINDERFAMQFGRSRIVNKKIGRLRLGLELGNKGLERKIIKGTLFVRETSLFGDGLFHCCLMRRLQVFFSHKTLRFFFHRILHKAS